MVHLSSLEPGRGSKWIEWLSVIAPKVEKNRPLLFFRCLCFPRSNNWGPLIDQKALVLRYLHKYYFAYYHSHNYINTTISTWRTTKSTICIFFHTHNYWPYIIHMSHNDKYLHITFFIIDFIIIMYITSLPVYKLVQCT